MATVLETIKVGLRRGGLSEDNSTYQDQGRTYLNAVAKEIEGESSAWWWKFKRGTITTTKTMTISGVSGTFTAGETITGGTSAKTATVVAYTAGETTLTFKSESGSFTASETITGGSSSATATYVSDVTTRLYDGGNDVLTLLSAFNETADDDISIADPRGVQKRDPVLTESGTVEAIYPWGVDSTSGNIQLGLYPKDSTTAQTVSFQYYAFTPDFTSANNSDSLNPYIHPTVQPALYFGIARLIKQQEGDDEGSLIELSEYQKVMKRALRNNIDIMGDMMKRRLEPGMWDGFDFSFTPREGSL